MSRHESDWERFNDQFRETEDERNERLRAKRFQKSATAGPSLLRPAEQLKAQPIPHDIVERLRKCVCESGATSNVIHDAVAEIERLRAERRKAFDRSADGAVWLKCEGNDAVVCIEATAGHWVEIIRECMDGPFSHICEPAGIFEKLCAAPLPEPPK